MKIKWKLPAKYLDNYIDDGQVSGREALVHAFVGNLVGELFSKYEGA